MSRALVCALFAASCAAPTKKQAIQSALDAGKAGRDAERAACLIIQSDRTLEKEPGLDEYCAAILKGCPK